MKMKLAEIARIIDGEVCGDDSTVITGISGIKEARAGDVTFVANSKYSALMKTTQASAIITSYEVNNSPKPLIKTKDPSLAFAKIILHVGPNKMKHPKGVHPTAIVADGVHLGQDVAVGPYAIVEKGASIGDRTIIYGGGYIGHDTRIGKDTIIYPLVSLRERLEIGDRVIVHSGTVIGSDGFGFATVQGVQEKIPQTGTVIIEDDVEIGANVTIDRARFDKTLISKGTKIDNLVQIAHNVTVGKHSIIVAQAGISGSTVVGDKVILAGQAGIVGHVSIGNGVVIAAQAGVTKSIPDNAKVSGYPAKPHEQAKRVNACVQRLPFAYSKIKELEEEVAKLKSIVDQLQNKVK